jgi:hypothetical protein
MAVGLFAVLVGGLLLVSLTSPDPEAIEAAASTSTTSTTLADVDQPIDLDNFSVDQLARGEPFEWESSLRVVEGYPIEFLSHDDSLYIFATEVPNFSSFERGGLRVWRSSDGNTWESLGQVIDQSHMIGSVSPTGQGLVALEYGLGQMGFTVWQSENGSEWEAEQISVDGANELTTVYPTAAGGVGALLLVAGQVQVDSLAPLRERLGDMADFGWGADVVGDEVQFTLYGPLGWRLGVVSADELNLTEEEEELIIDAYSGQTEVRANLWMKQGNAGWRTTAIPEANWIDRIATTPDGEVIAHGWGPMGAHSWTSKDGLNWEESPRPARHYLNDRWGNQLVAPHPNGGLSILVSTDGQEWEDIGPTESFPGLIQWWTGALAAGSGGIATTINGWDERAEPSEQAPDSQSASITNRDGTLIMDAQSGEYTLELADKTYNWPATLLNGVAVDLDTRSLRFLDTESGDLLTSFPLEDIIAAQSELVTFGPAESTGYGVFAFTSDGTEWTIQTFDEMGSGHAVIDLAVTETHVVATAVDSGAFYDPSLPPGFEVWTAAIP